MIIREKFGEGWVFQKYIVIGLFDYAGSKQKNKNNYSVEVKINRKAQK